MTSHSSNIAWRIPWTEPWQTTIQRVGQSQMRLRDFLAHTQDKKNIFPALVPEGFVGLHRTDQLQLL